MSDNQSYVEHEGFIINKADDYYNVRLIVKSACSACEIKGACSVSEITEKILQVKDEGISYLPNERVMVSMKSSLGLKAVLLGYILPFIIILTSLIIGVKVFKNDGIAAGVALLLTGVYYFVLYLFRSTLKNKFKYSIRKIN